MQQALSRPRLFRFTTLRGKLFTAFVGVLLLSLVLTAANFWVQLRLYDTQQVQADLQAAAPLVFSNIKRDLVRYWQASQPDRARLKADLQAAARPARVRILLTDYCNHIAVDTSITAPPRRYPQVPTSCSSQLEPLGPASSSPLEVPFTLRADSVQQVALPGSGEIFYLAYQAPSYPVYTLPQSGSSPLLVRTIVIAKSSIGVDQDALSSILPRLALAGAVAVLLTLLVVALIVRVITRPLRTITAASERMAAGDYNQRVPDAGEDEVGQLARSFNRMATEVGVARERQRQFIANVSHDLKTPLTSILGFSQILAESDSVSADPMGQRAVQVINEEAHRLQRLTRDLLDLSRLEAGQMSLRREPCDLNELAGTVLARYTDLPANSALHFRDCRSTGPLLVLGDADRLTQVLVNLLDNAVKFCDPGGTIELSTAERQDTVALTVANTGAGISAEDLTRVFGRFYRTDHSRATRTGGTGLGLAIVQEIMIAHGGQVEARSEIDGWTRFTVLLPRSRVVLP